jgi:hypothetical protein
MSASTHLKKTFIPQLLFRISIKNLHLFYDYRIIYSACLSLWNNYHNALIKTVSYLYLPRKTLLYCQIPSSVILASLIFMSQSHTIYFSIYQIYHSRSVLLANFLLHYVTELQELYVIHITMTTQSNLLYPANSS